MTEFSLVVVDMIRDYLEPSSDMYCRAAHRIIKPINRLSKAVRQKGGLVLFANTTLTSPSDPIARKWGMHAVKGTEGPELWPTIDYESDDLIIPKTSYNSFFQTDLDQTLRDKGITRTAITGIHTHVCVLLTAAAASDYGYDVITFTDAMTTNRRQNHASRLHFFSRHVGTLTNTKDFIKSLK